MLKLNMKDESYENSTAINIHTHHHMFINSGYYDGYARGKTLLDYLTLTLFNCFSTSPAQYSFLVSTSCLLLGYFGLNSSELTELNGHELTLTKL